MALLTMAVSASAAVSLWVAGRQVTSANMDLSGFDGVTGSVVLSQDPDTKAYTLTLTDATITGAGERHGALECNITMTLVVNGTCTIDGVDSCGVYGSFGISSPRTMTITGSGTLNIKGFTGVYMYNQCKLVVNGPTVVCEGTTGYGIGAREHRTTSSSTTFYGNLEMLSGTVKAKGPAGSIAELGELTLGSTTMFTSPSGAAFNATTHQVEASGALATDWVTIDYYYYLSNSTIFPDANFRAYLQEQSFAADGILTNEERLAVKIIDVRSRNIADLTGFGLFSNLEELICNYNKITKLDLRFLPKLWRLACGDNQLQSIDVSHLPELKRLFVFGNPITSLDLTLNPKVYYLRCDSCNLKELKLPEYAELDTLRCTNNSLTTLDLSKCPKLKDVVCNDNLLTSLNLSGCTELEFLICATNSLATLDLSQCPKIKIVSCNDNLLTSINLSGCKNLESLLCERNQLTSLDFSGCSSELGRETVSVAMNYIDVEGGLAMIESLPEMHHGGGITLTYDPSSEDDWPFEEHNVFYDWMVTKIYQKSCNAYHITSYKSYDGGGGVKEYAFYYGRPDPRLIDPGLSFKYSEENPLVLEDGVHPTSFNLQDYLNHPDDLLPYYTSSNDLEYSSSNKDVARVWNMKTGKVSFSDYGTTTITVRYLTDGTKYNSATAKMTVTYKENTTYKEDIKNRLLDPLNELIALYQTMADGMEDYTYEKGKPYEDFLQELQEANAFLVKQAAEKLGVPLGDVNGDGELTIADVVAIVNTILQKDDSSSSAAGARAKTPVLPASALSASAQPLKQEAQVQELQRLEPLPARMLDAPLPTF